MQAIVQTRYGSPDDLELRDVPTPVVGDHDVLVRVRAASIHPDVWHVISGRPYAFRLLGPGLIRPKRAIPGTDMAGIVDAAGTSVTRFRPGDAVFGETVDTQQLINGGALAEYVSVPHDLLALKPDNVTFEQAAAVPTSGVIALNNLRDRSRLGPGHRVLINGAGGGVGALALQIVKAYGAHVTAVDSSRKLETLRRLGANEVIDFTQHDFTRLGIRYDLIFDVPMNHSFSACRRALKPDGRYVPIGHDRFGASGRVFGILPRFLRLLLLSRFVTQLRGPGTALPTRKEAMAILGELLAAGKITPIIDSTFPLSEVRAAFRRMIEEETQGKVIITVSGA